MGDGMILDLPTIFGAAGGKLLAGGEAGPEAVVGVDSLRTMIQETVAGQTAVLAQAIGAAGGGDITIPVYVGGTLLGFKAKLVQDTSYGGLWSVVFILNLLASSIIVEIMKHIPLFKRII